MSVGAFLNTLGTRCHALPVVILYVTEGCNLKCISCSYRAAPEGELTLGEIAALGRSLREAGLRHIVYSGGEPLTRRDFPDICALFAAPAERSTLLTNGLLLEKRFAEISPFLDEFIVSLDGADAATHDAIRGIASYDLIVRGLRRVADAGRGKDVAIRTVVQKRNFRSLPAMVSAAREIGAGRISFLAADVRSSGFGRLERGEAAPAGQLTLDPEESAELRRIVERMAVEFAAEFETRFIDQSPSRMLDIASYYEALNGSRPFPPTSCNAPMVSTVITSRGDVLPCYFLPPLGNVRRETLGALLGGEAARRTRRDVRSRRQPECATCVCTLRVGPAQALAGRF
ncbi:MAG TPA: radical SAM protein [Bacteroidota bacterium]|nr:radical SAM protein [Bacteroidota bacterium]